MHSLRVFLLFAACLLHALPLAAQNVTVRISEPFARAAPAGRAAAAYMNIQGGPDRLIGASCDIAGQVELHETAMDGGVVSMRPVGGILINPGIATRLAPGGLHVMLMDLKRPLKDGDNVTLTLTFERAGKRTVIVPVARTGARTGPSVAVPGLAGPR
jgi:copper(I)-binding protein